MDLKLNRENLICSAAVLDEEVSQNAEHDFILPDYCPDIFRVLKCSVIPGIVSTGINGNRLTFDLSVIIRVLYRSDESSGIYCVEQNLDFSKTLDLPADAVNPSVSVVPSAEYVNCRVVNQRRLDVRGNVVCRVKVVGEKSCEAVCDAFGCGIQLKKAPVIFPAKRLTSAKRITVVEEMELAAGKPKLGSIIRCDASVRKGEQKIIPGKLITKGDAEISILYLAKDSSDNPPECMKFTIPFSQIIDIDGIDESFEADVDICASKCLIMPKSDESGTLECELILLVNITAVRYDTCELVTDAYSTVYECDCESLDCAPPSAHKKISASVSLQSTLTCSDGEIARVYDLWCESPSISARQDEIRNCTVLYGKATFCMLGKLTDGTAAYAEKECAFEQPLELGEEYGGENISANPTVTVTGCSYTIGEGGVQAKAELSAGGTVEKKSTASLLKSISVFTDKPKERDKKCAVKICYSDMDGSLWDIAKKYSTSAEAILEENDISENVGRRVLIIPMKN